MIKEKPYYLNTFGVTDSTLEELIGTALSHGGNYADLYFENTYFSNLMLRDGEVTSGGFHIDYGVGIRVLCGEKSGYAYSESTDKASMISAAKAASAISQGSSKAIQSIARDNGYVPKLYRGTLNPAADRYPAANDWREAKASEFIPLILKLESLIKSKDSRIVKIIISLQSQVSDLLMYNSFYEMKYETRPMGTLAATVILSSEGQMLQLHSSRSFRMGTEMLTNQLLEELAAEVTKNIDDRFEAKRPKGGKMQVVMGAGASGILLHEAMGHAFEADFNRKGQSIFADKIGSRVCAQGINIVDDGTIRGNRGSINFDDEGVPAQRTYMVEDGILTSYLHDRISAEYFGVAPTGNGRRENFRYAPLPRMRATYMESGNASPADIIGSVRKGIYVDEFSNGEVKIGEGDFTFYVKSGYLIENGRLTRPVKDINVIGNGPKALENIVAVGNDCKIDDSAWTCGKGQSVAVSCGIPTVLVNNLTVGGE